MLDFPRHNNFEWLRLIFATQVLLVHGADHFGLKIPHFINYFPGVPAFFFVSGFLIYASYINTPGKRYFVNRFLRLFPALFFVTTGGAFLAMYAHAPSDFITHFSTYGIWILSQLTIGQAYNPSHFRDIGVGVINGSLWTITTEILFYLCIPLIVTLERRFRYTLWILIIISFSLYAAGPHVLTRPVYRDRTVYDILALTPVVWGWMFGFGILAVRYFHVYRTSLKYFYIAFPFMLFMMKYSHKNFLLNTQGNTLGLLYFLCYITLILWISFGLRYVKLPFDFSYGVYIWHMPVINFLLVISIKNLLLATVMTFCISIFSWFFIEKPALRLKKHSLKPVT
ncbi:MAG: acyltransferase [Chlorobiaceae bacterium]|jgi:peptidoglycan/LPS O-acetylase OafA/YrhL|nr:acyltransferase [Chlorobiaceae bacterium]